jgi:HSP20 family protein
MREEMDRFFDEPLFHWPQMWSAPMTTPAVNVYETEKDVVVEAAVPGLEEKDIHIEATEDSLTLRCQKQAKREEEQDGYYRQEFSYGSFSRTIDIPVAVKSEEAKAELKQGKLTITIPKLEPSKPKATKVPIVAR